MLRRGRGFSSLPHLPLALGAARGQVLQDAEAATGIGSVAALSIASALAEAGRARLDIVIFCGPALEPWTPSTLRATGLGGSETMAWELSRQLVRLGHRVRVFGHCSGMEGTFDGVEWLDFQRYQRLTCDVLISSKQPAAVDDKHRLQARVRVLWLHEAHCGDKLTADRARKFDAYWCLSAWHAAYFRRAYPHIESGKVLQIRNGIDPDAYRAREGEIRDAHRAIYSSCPSRGLNIALDSWPAIRAHVPDATLHVYYGFENLERSAALTKDEAMFATIREMKRRIADTAGVVFHGRVGPSALAHAFRVSGVWPYPDLTPETSCITAMQAQAAGLKIVSSALAALNETVANRGVLIPGDPESEGYKAAFIAATVAAMTTVTQAERAELEAYAERHFNLTNLAEDVESILTDLFVRAGGSVAAPLTGL